MTKSEVVEKYGNVILTFDYYYKYMFTYSGVADDGAKICLSYGGVPDDIYKHTVSNNDTHKFSDAIEWASIVVVKNKEKEIYSDVMY